MRRIPAFISFNAWLAQERYWVHPCYIPVIEGTVYSFVWAVKEANIS